MSEPVALSYLDESYSFVPIKPQIYIVFLQDHKNAWLLSSILLDNLDSLEKIDNYFKEYDKVILKIKEIIINKNINFISADVIM